MLGLNLDFDLVVTKGFRVFTQYSIKLQDKQNKNKLRGLGPTKRPPLVGEVGANFCGYSVSSGQRNGYPRSYLLSYTHEAEWTSFQTQYYSENLVAPGIEPKTSESVAKNSDH
jgi:hypothetical protein